MCLHPPSLFKWVVKCLWGKRSEVAEKVSLREVTDESGRRRAQLGVQRLQCNSLVLLAGQQSLDAAGFWTEQSSSRRLSCRVMNIPLINAAKGTRTPS